MILMIEPNETSILKRSLLDPRNDGETVSTIKPEAILIKVDDQWIQLQILIDHFRAHSDTMK